MVAWAGNYGMTFRLVESAGKPQKQNGGRKMRPMEVIEEASVELDSSSTGTIMSHNKLNPVVTNTNSSVSSAAFSFNNNSSLESPVITSRYAIQIA